MRKVFASIHANVGKAKAPSKVSTRFSNGKFYMHTSFSSSDGSTEYVTGICVKALPDKSGDLKVRDVNTDKMVKIVAPTTRGKFKVRCTCPDYEMTYAFPNHEHKMHYGKLPEVPKTAGTSRRPRNPERLPGGCKHIIALYRTCCKKNYITPG